jgi:putative ABC transport system substrate-binding protein
MVAQTQRGEMNNRRKLVIALGAGAFAPLASFAQQATKMYRIGYLDASSADSRAAVVEYVRAGLRDLGYTEGKNIQFEFRWGEGKYERLLALAADLVRMKVDVLVADGTPCTHAAKQATSTIPIVMVSVGDPIASGIVASLARPVGNVTGNAILSPELMLKRFELLNETSPRTKQVAILLNPGNPSHANNFKAAETAARSLKLGLQKFETKNLDEIKSAFVTMTKRGVDAVVVPVDTMFSSNRQVIAILAETHRLPAFGDAELAKVGGLIGLGTIRSDIYRGAATYIDKILKGAKPIDLPVEQPIKFELIVNLKTAKALGIKIPNSIMVRADRVIE